VNDSLHIDKKKQRDWNPGTIEKLKRAGSNLKLTHSIENVFYSEEKRPLLNWGIYWNPRAISFWTYHIILMKMM